MPNGSLRGYAGKPPEPPPVTSYVADFIINTRYPDIPPEVIELAKKSILDGIGLALCGSVAQTGEIVRTYLKSNGFVSGAGHGATVIGSSLKAPVRFAAFANAVGIHADDYDDTQLAVAEDRVYGLLTHPTAPVLPAALAAGEVKFRRTRCPTMRWRPSSLTALRLRNGRRRRAKPSWRW